MDERTGLLAAIVLVDFLGDETEEGRVGFFAGGAREEEVPEILPFGVVFVVVVVEALCAVEADEEAVAAMSRLDKREVEGEVEDLVDGDVELLEG